MDSRRNSNSNHRILRYHRPDFNDWRLDGDYDEFRHFRRRFSSKKFNWRFDELGRLKSSTDDLYNKFQPLQWDYTEPLYNSVSFISSVQTGRIIYVDEEDTESIASVDGVLPDNWFYRKIFLDDKSLPGTVW